MTFHDADWTSAVSPAVSVIAQPAYEVGGTAMELLASRLAGFTGPARSIELPMRFLDRDSIAIPPA